MFHASRSEPIRRPGHDRARVYAVVVLAGMAATTPWLLRGVVGALGSNSNDPQQWLPRGFEETETYRWFQRQFGNDEITVVSWPGCTLEDDRAGRLGRALVRDRQPALFERAITGRQMVRALTAPRVALTEREAIRRLTGMLIGPDGRTTCVVLILSERGAADRAAAVEQVRRVAREECGLAPEQLRLGGPTVDAATIDVESQRLLVELAGLAAVVSLAITWLRLRSVRLAVIIMVAAVTSAAVALSILYYTGGVMNLVMTMLPPLIYVLSISAAVHLANYYRDALKEGAREDAALRALACGWRPCALASGTTAVGLLSLAVSEIVPVKMFGIYSAAGMAASFLVVLLFLPAALTLWPGSSASVVPNLSGEVGRARSDRLVDGICRRPTLVAMACLLIMACGACGLPRLRSTVKLQYRFHSDSRILRDYGWLETHLGPLVPMELVVQFEGASDLDFLEQLRVVERIGGQLRRMPAVGVVFSGADFSPESPRGGSLRNVARRAVLKRRAGELEQAIRKAHYLADGDRGEPLWRISVRAPALSDVDYGRFVETLRRGVGPVIERVEETRVTYTGVIPLIYKAQRELLSDLVESFFLAFGVIAVVMVVALRDPVSGLLAMVPNVFPAVVIFGLMGWLGVRIEIGSIMTASAAMGIAVDDTFHLLTWFRSGTGRGLPRSEALRSAVQRCAGAMVHTTLICSLGLLVFSLSSFMPIVRFARLMATLLVAALVGDLILLPAILASPLGERFTPRGRAKVSEPSGERGASAP